MFTKEEEIATVFKALCDSKRIAILKCLQSNDTCACELIERLNIAQSALSYHMKILCASGIVESWNEGKWVHYRISRTGSDVAMKLLQELTTTNDTKETTETLSCDD